MTQQKHTLSWSSELQKALDTSFLCHETISAEQYQARLLHNNPDKEVKILQTLRHELEHARRFDFSVAFITDSGVTSLLTTLEELAQKNIRGRILTTDYQHVTTPQALKLLAKFPNLRVKLFRTQGSDKGFHTKAYLFTRANGERHFIVGSANWTQYALSCNEEWATLFVAHENAQMTRDLDNAFADLWDHPQSIPVDEIIDEYTTRFTAIHQTQIARPPRLVPPIGAKREFSPNTMQTSFLDELARLRKAGEKKALLISATGTGKTFAAAFAARTFGPKARILFVVHRKQIAQQAKESFTKILGPQRTYGIVGNGLDQIHADTVFATIQTIGQTSFLQKVPSDTFDCIIIDEVHHAAANLYQNVLAHFHPQFWLGMTATPERMDDADIFALFDYNIAQEIRLKDALENDLLCPFHYFGITEFSASGTEDKEDFLALNLQDQYDYIAQRIAFYPFSGSRRKGLIFARNKEHAAEITRELNARGFRCATLTGEDSVEKRRCRIERLVSDSLHNRNPLDFLVTVDIFNEGVDIPEINLVVFLRPTQSPIIFVQQMGRGLRRAKKKEYVVILDFIGRYENNYMIPIALYGDRRYRKDALRRYVTTGIDRIPGASSIQFDAIAKERVLAAIDAGNFSTPQNLKQAFVYVKRKIGRTPKLLDFVHHGEISPLLFFESSDGSYGYFLKKLTKDAPEEAQKRAHYTKEYHHKILKTISNDIGFGKFALDIDCMRLCVHLVDNPIEVLKDRYADQGTPLTRAQITYLQNYFSGLWRSSASERPPCYPFASDGSYQKAWVDLMQDQVFVEDIKDILTFARYENKNYDPMPRKGYPFTIGQTYSYYRMMRGFAWEKSLPPTNVGGYYFHKPSRTFPVFINYHKDEQAIAYHDRFIDREHIIAISKTNRHAKSAEIPVVFHQGEYQDVQTHLFIRRHKELKNETSRYYYLGTVSPYGNPIRTQTDQGKRVYEVHYHLHRRVPEGLYDYIVHADIDVKPRAKDSVPRSCASSL